MLREGKNEYGMRALLGTLTCPKCGTSNEVSFTWRDASDASNKRYMEKHRKTGPGYWHISKNGSFNHDENSLGGADIWCCGDRICRPNG